MDGRRGYAAENGSRGRSHLLIPAALAVGVIGGWGGGR